MPYVTSVERLAKEEGRVETLQKVVHKLIDKGQSDEAIMTMLDLNLNELSRLKCE